MSKPDALERLGELVEYPNYGKYAVSLHRVAIRACAEVAEEMEREQMRAAGTASSTGDSSLERQALHKAKIMGDFIERLRSVVEGGG